MRFSKTEIKELFRAWIVISIAFAMVTSGGIVYLIGQRSILSLSFLLNIFISAITVGLGFIVHELAHKLIAQRYGCFAEFRYFPQMLLISLASALFFGIVYAAPGAVFIHGYVSHDKRGKISLAGPLSNLILALIFFCISLGLKFYPINFNLINYIFIQGYRINTWLCLFNLIPFGLLDGVKVFAWNRKVYFSVIGIALVLMML